MLYSFQQKIITFCSNEKKSNFEVSFWYICILHVLSYLFRSRERVITHEVVFSNRPNACNSMGATCCAGSALHSRTPEISPSFMSDSWWSVFSFLCCVLVFFFYVFSLLYTKRSNLLPMFFSIPPPPKKKRKKQFHTKLNRICTYFIP